MGNTTNNTVTINGGTIGENVYGGCVDDGTAGTQLAQNNTVTISGAPTFTDTVIYGGWIGDNSNNMLTTSEALEKMTLGNTLNLKTKGISAKNIANFEKLYFYLPSNIAKGDTVLTLTDTVATDLSRVSTIGVGMQRGAKLEKADTVTLINNATGGITAPANLASKVYAKQGIALDYEFELLADANNLTATVANTTAAEEAKSPLETSIGSVAFANQGADLIADSGLSSAISSTQRSGNGEAGFGAISGGKSKYKSGSHVDVKGFSLMAGVAKASENSLGNLTAGVFVEAGFGNYDSYNNFASGATKGNGDNRYYGVGFALKENFNMHNLYFEASLRIGTIKSDYKSNELLASYDSQKNYYGAHLGLGKILELNKSNNIDLYTKLFYTRQDKDDVTILGDEFNFKAVESIRARLGAKYNFNFTENITYFAGAAYEREFDGKAKGSTYGLNIDSPSIKGNTGIFELGTSFKPSNNSGLSLDATLQGFVGKREGVNGGLNVKYQF